MRNGPDRRPGDPARFLFPGAPGESVDVFELDPGRISTAPDSIQMLHYLMGCALGEGQRADVTMGSAHYRMPGSLGLAPAWKDRALNPSEQRWVSACMGALLNKFGVTVPISLRGEHAALRPSLDERERFTLYEGGFFGNIFGATPALFSCSSGLDLSDFDVGRVRVCAQPEPQSLEGSVARSRCTIGHVGACPSGSEPPADEFIAVFLDPDFEVTGLSP